MITIGSILKYSVMPQIAPRLQSLFFGGMGYIPYMIALVYQVVGLLPKYHPYTLSENIGRFGVRSVVAAAANNLSWNLKNIDQIVLFFAVLTGLILFALQILMLLLGVFMGSAIAMPTSWAGYFTLSTSEAYHDIAYMMLDLVLGVPSPDATSDSKSFFGSCIAASVNCQNSFGQNIENINMSGYSTEVDEYFSPLSQGAYKQFPFPMHIGLHILFQLYSTGLLLIAVFIACYFIAAILAETAQTGTPFGRRFNKTWAPLRIVLAFGLLMPLSAGLNSAQYIVLYAAKYGSAFASNGWTYYNTVITDSYLENGQSLVAIPNTPDFNDLNRFLQVAKACGAMYDYYAVQEYNKNNSTQITKAEDLPDDQKVKAYILGRQTDTAAPSKEATTTMAYSPQTAYFAYKDDIMDFLDEKFRYASFVFGVKSEDKYAQQPGFVKPVCGEVQLLLSDMRDAPSGPTPPSESSYPISEDKADYAAMIMQIFYYWVITNTWSDDGYLTSLGYFGEDYSEQFLGENYRYLHYLPEAIRDGFYGETTYQIEPAFVEDTNNFIRLYIESSLNDKIKTHLVRKIENSETYYEKGWGAAGIWYNRIAEMHSIVATSYAPPVVKRYPSVMEKMVEINNQYNKDINPQERFKPELANLKDPKAVFSGPHDMEIVNTLWSTYSAWNANASNKGGSSNEKNPIIAMISYIFGVDGLYRLKDNPDTHPLAMITGVGRSLVESSVRSFGITAASVLASYVGVPKAVARMVASFSVTISMLGLTIGVVLFYVIPFLPFIYFFFALGGWVKGIFEALVGAPLWALAHIRIDGDGLPGKAGTVGYYLVFEVFLRPIMIVFGLIASIAVFSALVGALNTMFDGVVQNIGGMDVTSRLEDGMSLSSMRSRIDEFFYTVMYAVLVYLIGMSCFKMVDMVPNNILRWMGQSVSSFNDQQENPAEGMVGKMQMGSQQAIGKIGGGLGRLVGTI